MGNNKLFQLAESAVHRVETSTHAAITPEEFQEAHTKVNVAKNDLSSAFANSTEAEKAQLQELQQRLEKAEHYLSSDEAKKPKY